MLLLIDNYDSFTYNLAQYLMELGAEVVVRRNDAITVEEAAALAPERIVISPGPCTPHEAGISCALIERLGPTIPILGVCLGHQCIAHAFGGRVVRAPAPVHGKTAAIHHHGAGVLRGLPSPFTATRTFRPSAATPMNRMSKNPASRSALVGPSPGFGPPPGNEPKSVNPGPPCPPITISS